MCNRLVYSPHPGGCSKMPYGTYPNRISSPFCLLSAPKVYRTAYTRTSPALQGVYEGGSLLYRVKDRLYLRCVCNRIPEEQGFGFGFAFVISYATPLKNASGEQVHLTLPIVIYSTICITLTASVRTSLPSRNSKARCPTWSWRTNISLKQRTLTGRRLTTQ